jgi:hypothetical protein
VDITKTGNTKFLGNDIMELKTDTEIIECPSCQGQKTVEWNHTEYPCLLCNSTGYIELERLNS